MTKPTFQDIIPPDRRSIKHVPVPNRSVRRLRVPDDESPANKTDERPERATRSKATVTQPTPTISPASPIPPPYDYHPAPPPHRIPFYEERDPYRRRFPWKASIVLLCAIAIIVGTYFTLSHFAKATVTITPKTKTVTLNNQFMGAIMATTSTVTNSANQISYQVISITKDGKMSIASTGQTTQESRATGQITIFNNYSTSPQKLISGTRFATPSGLVYRIGAAIIVPGKNNGTPGSATVTVIADQPGDQYNVGLSDFVIPGLSGTPAYKGIYGRSKTPITGGFSGIQPKVDPAALAAAQATIDAELEGTLLSLVRQQTPPNEILMPNAYILSYQHLATTAASSSQAVVNEEGIIYAFVFNNTQLSNTIAATANASSSPSTSSDTTWQISDPSDLEFALTTASSTIGTALSLSTISFRLSGSVDLVAAVDISKIKSNLAGRPKSDFNPILAGFSGIANATMTIEPFWQKSFPVNPQNITVKSTI